MGNDQTHKLASYFSGCISCMSPASCFIPEKYSRLDNNVNNKTSQKKLKNIIDKIASESKNVYGSPKPLRFHYDAVSYSQNFDDGCHKEECLTCRPMVAS
ncbi:hypothetical protein LIER_21206 [Lithospermum erythrorhizon]|uniref:Uncharacterized protein n=1 Tax=Lithospermum erythrorhizon TaxID=34254 RepID=A0AAV3QRV7_LITER